MKTKDITNAHRGLPMDITELELIINLMREKKVSELKMDALHVKLFDDFEQPELPEKARKILEKLEDEEASDEDILMNPYAGME